MDLQTLLAELTAKEAEYMEPFRARSYDPDAEEIVGSDQRELVAEMFQLRKQIHELQH